MSHSILLSAFSELSPEQREAIIEQEIGVMLPILQAIDLPVSADGLRKAIERKPAARLILLAEEATGAPRAWIRYSRGEESLFVESIQLGTTSLHLRPLLRAALPAIASEQIPQVVSVVQGNADAPLSLHRRLGFKIEKELPRATRFAIAREELLEKLIALEAPTAH